MIFTERTITIRNDSASINTPVILYRGDKNVEVRFTLVESPYKYSNRDSINIIESTDAAYAQLIIKTPNDRDPIFGDITAVGQSNIIFVIEYGMIDEIGEVGTYDFQIRLFDSDQTSMVTIPEVVGGFIIKEPIAKEDTANNITNSAIVGSAVVTSDVSIPTFVGGSYNKTAWYNGTVISRQKLDKIEDGIYETYELSKDNSSQIKEKVNISTFNSKVWSMSNMGQDVKEAMTGGSVPVVGKDSILEENIVDRQVTRRKTSFYSVWQDGNLLSREINTKNFGYIYLSDGTISNGDAYTLKLTLEDIDFINIPLRFNFTSHITFWDESDTFISGYIQGSLDDGENTELLKNIPSNAKYVRMSLWLDRINNAIIAKDSIYHKDLKTKYLDDSLHILQDNLDPNLKFKKSSIEGIELYPFGNLVDKNKLIYGKWWNTSGESKTTTDCTFEFEIDPTEQYRFNFTSHITYWDENYEFISGYIQGSLDNGINTGLLKNIPSNAKYVRMLLYASRVNDAIFALDSVYSRDLKCVYYMKNFIASDENLNNKQNKNPLYGKKAIFFGDSWCAGNTSQPGGWAGWIKANNPSMTITNCGRHGADWWQCYNAWFEDTNNYNSLPDDADYIIIEAYTNGLYELESELNKSLGIIDEFTYYNSIAEIESALGDTHARDLEKCLYSIVKRWNGKKIGLMFPYKSVDMLNENNAFRKFREQVFKCCRKYNIPVFDNFDGCNIPSWSSELRAKYYLKDDTVHLNKAGYDIICPPIENWIKTL